MTRVCVLGSVNADLVVRAPRFPAPGETLLGGPFAVHPGGKGANQAVAAARLGASVSLVGAVGADAHGEARLAELRAEGVDVAHVRRCPDAATGIAVITVVNSAENTIVVAPGANALVTPADVEAARALIAAADVLVAQLEIPLATVARTATLARELGTPFLLNAAPAASLADELMSLVEMLVVNLGEARHLAGAAEFAGPCPSDPLAEAHQLARRLLARGPRRVVITLGPDGAGLWSATERVRCAAPRVDAIDTTGCGDAFVGALASAWGAAAERALERACRAGGLAATRPGAASSFPRAAELA